MVKRCPMHIGMLTVRLEREAQGSPEPQMTPLYSGLLEALQAGIGVEEVEPFTRCFGFVFSESIFRRVGDENPEGG